MYALFSQSRRFLPVAEMPLPNARGVETAAYFDKAPYKSKPAQYCNSTVLLVKAVVWNGVDSIAVPQLGSTGTDIVDQATSSHVLGRHVVHVLMWYEVRSICVGRPRQHNARQ